MKKLALILWSVVPRKLEQSLCISDSTYRFKMVWFGKTFIVYFKA